MSPIELLFILFIFALPFVFAIASATIAKRKGYNQVVFGLLGFFFSIFGLILILVLPDRSKSREVDAASLQAEQGAHGDS